MPSTAAARVASVLAGPWLAPALRPVGATGTLLPPLFFSTTVSHLLELSPSQTRPPCTFILFSTRCALCHCLFHSRPPPLSFPLSHVDYLSLFYCSLFLVRCLPLSGKQLFLSASAHSLPIHWIFPVFSHSTSIAALHLFPSSRPIIFPFNSPHTLFSFGSAHCLNLDEHVSLHPPPSFFPSASLSLHLHTVPSVFAKHWEAENHHSVNLLLLHESAATFRCPQNCRRKHKVVEP